MLKDGLLFTGKIITKGRVSGLPRTVELRLVYLDGQFYASTTSLNRKHWCRNLLKEPAVEVLYRGEHIPCVSRILSDDARQSRVLCIRGVADGEKRTVFEMTPQSPWRGE